MAEGPIILTDEDKLVQKVRDEYQAAYIYKESLGLHSTWAKAEDYWRGEQNPPEDADDPGSVTNIIQPIIESMVADLVSEPMEVSVKGWTATDRAAAPHAQLALEWILEKQNLPLKQDRFERQRLKFGTGIWKVYFAGNRGPLGMPMVDVVGVQNFFPDPKVKQYMDLNLADYIIHAVPRSLSYIRRMYPDKGKFVQPEPHPRYSTEIFGIEPSSYYEITQNQALLLERWTIEDDGHLRKVVVANDVLLYDSDKDEKRKDGYYALDRYPFIVVPCYQREGTLWGLSDFELLKPVQDLINDLDDQIRLNARLMGNIQVVVAVASGINPLKWTAKPGLRIPARDVNAFRIVEPPNIPAYVVGRRTEALNYEAQFISGRTDAVEGRKVGSLRAASAIIALQEAGLKRVNHKKLLAQRALSEVFSIILDYVAEYWTEEIEIGEEVRWRGADLKNLPILTESGAPLLDNKGQPMTRRANFDITVNFGAGMPSNKAFVYQAALEMTQYGLITKEEGRAIIKQVLNWPIIDPWNPVGEFVQQVSQPNPAELTSTVGMSEGPMFSPQDIPPDFLNTVVSQLGGASTPTVGGNA